MAAFFSHDVPFYLGYELVIILKLGKVEVFGHELSPLWSCSWAIFAELVTTALDSFKGGLEGLFVRIGDLVAFAYLA